jgi:partner of Y14 and mago protein
MDAIALPKGHILGWGAPTGTGKKAATATDNTGKPLTKSQKKNEKRREKKREEKPQEIKDNWEDEDEEEETSKAVSTDNSASTKKNDESKKVDALADQLKETVNFG